MPTNFKKLMVARFLFTFAVQMQAIVLGWRMYMLTQSPLCLGLIGLAEAIPALGLAMYAGYVVDRSRPLFIYRSVVWVSFLSALVLFLSQLKAMSLGTQAQVAALFASSLLTGGARAFSQPAMFVIVPKLIKRENLSKASAWMATAMQTARISGPALGGIFVGWIGVSGSAVAVCAILLMAAIGLYLINIQIDAPKAIDSKTSTTEQLLSGARFVFKHPILLPALSLDMVSVLFGGVTSLLPIYAAEILRIGPKGLGLLRAAPSFGAAIASLWLTSHEIRKKAGVWLFSAVTGFGVCILIFALSRDFMLSLVALALSGVFDSVSMVIRSALVQLSSPDSMRGRISAVNSMFIGSSNELGEFESGVAARFFGTVPAAVFGGCVCIVTVAFVALRSSTLRNLDIDLLRDNTAV